MAGNELNATKLDERDDFQHLRAQQLLALRVIAPPRSKLGALIEERLGQLYAEMGEELDPAKRKQNGRIQDRTSASEDLEKQTDLDNAPVVGSSLGTISTLASDAGLGNQSATMLQDRTTPTEKKLAPPKTPGAKQPVEKQKAASAQPHQQVEVTQQAWMWMLSQLLKTDLKRLGLEPDELNDIRVFLIKNEAKKYDKLELLSKLPASLSPEAITKIFEDIRTMAAGYVAFVTVERLKSALEDEDEMKQMPQLPRSISRPFYEIPLVDFDPEEVMQKLSEG
jgi:hypothetical protein